jgi:hypothetical protein
MRRNNKIRPALMNTIEVFDNKIAKIIRKTPGK